MAESFPGTAAALVERLTNDVPSFHGQVGGTFATVASCGVAAVTQPRRWAPSSGGGRRR